MRVHPRRVRAPIAGLGALCLWLAIAPPASAMVSRSVLREVIRAASPRLRQCASGAPTFVAGRVVVSFLIAPDGHVAEAEVTTNETGSVALAECVARAVLELVFPPNERGGGIRVNYPFRFEPPL